MDTIEIIFWSLISLIFYTYLGFPIILYIIVKIKSLFTKKESYNHDFEPEVTLLIAAYNEVDFMNEKIKNSLELDYPKEKLRILFVTDGSDDGTPEMIEQHGGIDLLHQNKRAGKIGAMNRGMNHVSTPIVVFTDANTYLNKKCIRNIVRHFADEKVGCVAGEKRIMQSEVEGASAAGEGLYWKYESALKRWDSSLSSVMGAAGELFAIRTDLYEHVESDTLLDDFIMSFRVIKKKYRAVYEPDANASETASETVKDELKRKVRICAGGIQSIVRLLPLLNPFKYGVITWQYVSHRVLRWTLTPIALLALIPINIVLLNSGQMIYFISAVGQIAFYSAALIGWYFQSKEIKIKALFVPYYFFIMNLSVFLGFSRYIRGRQSVIWERAARAKNKEVQL